MVQNVSPIDFQVISQLFSIGHVRLLIITNPENANSAERIYLVICKQCNIAIGNLCRAVSNAQQRAHLGSSAIVYSIRSN